MPKGAHNKGKGKCYLWIRAQIAYSGEGCLIWPFSRDRDGYGLFSANGENFKAHRWMCEAVNGAAPTPKHYAAHDCGKGHLGCIHPKHLVWKTQDENALDTIRHGTSRKGRRGPLRKLTQEQVLEILALKGQKSSRAVGVIYGIHDRHIRLIWSGGSWKDGQPQTTGGSGRHPHLFTAEEILRIRRAVKGEQQVMAREFGVSQSVISKIKNRLTYAHIQEEQEIAA